MPKETKTPADRALFKLQFGIQMFNCGRADMASERLIEAQQILQKMVQAEKLLDA